MSTGMPSRTPPRNENRSAKRRAIARPDEADTAAAVATPPDAPSAPENKRTAPLDAAIAEISAFTATLPIKHSRSVVQAHAIDFMKAYALYFCRDKGLDRMKADPSYTPGFAKFSVKLQPLESVKNSPEHLAIATEVARIVKQAGLDIGSQQIRLEELHVKSLKREAVNIFAKSLPNIAEMFLAQVNAEDYGKHCLVSDLLSQHSDDVLTHLAITRDDFVNVYKAVNKVNSSMEPAEGVADEGDVLRLRGGAPSNSNQNAASGAGNSNQTPPPIHAPLANHAAAPNATTPAAQPPATLNAFVRTPAPAGRGRGQYGLGPGRSAFVPASSLLAATVAAPGPAAQNQQSQALVPVGASALVPVDQTQTPAPAPRTASPWTANINPYNNAFYFEDNSIPPEDLQAITQTERQVYAEQLRMSSQQRMAALQALRSVDQQRRAASNGGENQPPAPAALLAGAVQLDDDVEMSEGQDGDNTAGGTSGAVDDNGDPSATSAGEQATRQLPPDNPYGEDSTQQPAIPTVVRQQRDDALSLLLLSVVHAFVRPQEAYTKQYDANALEARLNKVAARQKLEASADGTAELLNSEEVIRPPTLKKMVEETTERDKIAQNRKIQSLEHRLRNAEAKAVRFEKQAQKQGQNRDSTSGKDSGAQGGGAKAKKSQPAPGGNKQGKPKSNAQGAAAAANASSPNRQRRGKEQSNESSQQSSNKSNRRRSKSRHRSRKK